MSDAVPTPASPLGLTAPPGSAPATGTRGVLHVIHGHGGGTEHHARALIGASGTRFRHCLAVAVGDHWQVEEFPDGGAPGRSSRRGSVSANA